MTDADSYKRLQAWQVANKNRWAVIEIQGRIEILVQLWEWGATGDAVQIDSQFGVSLGNAVANLKVGEKT